VNNNHTISLTTTSSNTSPKHDENTSAITCLECVFTIRRRIVVFFAFNNCSGFLNDDVDDDVDDAVVDDAVDDIDDDVHNVCPLESKHAYTINVDVFECCKVCICSYPCRLLLNIDIHQQFSVAMLQSFRL
jgi:hypothetical protein